MSALLRLTAGRVPHNIRMDMLASSMIMEITKSGYGLELSGAKAILKGGKDAGQTLDGPLAANQRVYFPMGVLLSPRHQVQVEVNPMFYSLGDVRIVRIAEPKEQVPLVIHFRAEIECDLSTIPWLVRLYWVE